MMWPAGIAKPGRTVDDFVSFIDFAPTFLELAEISEEQSGMQPIQGRSLTNILSSETDGQVEKERDYVLIGKERHDLGRPNDWGYPIRGIVKNGYLYIRNFEPDRWPAGHPLTGYMNTDGSPTKTFILNQKRAQGSSQYWDLAFGKRPPEEMYRIEEDPECMHNLANDPEFAGIRAELRTQMETELIAQGDPRMLGNGHVFDEYKYAHGGDYYERFMRGEAEAGWIEKTDIENEMPR
jgi:arylsulfatase A-like enzyme